MFGILYILLVYLTFISDFFLYTSQYGIVQKASFVMAEAVIIMTVVSLILILEVLAQFTNKVDPNGKRNGLIKYAEKANRKKRRVLRSGMGNDEEEYDEEYDSEESGEEI